MTILFVLLLLVLASAFFSLAEISLAASRRLRIEMLAKEGNAAAKRILHLQDQPGHYFTVVQIGLNGVAILAGAVGESSITPSLEPLAALVLPPEYAGSVASSIAFLAVTLLFVVLADLVPKRLALLAPERIALVVAPPMTLLMRLLHPLVWAIDALASAVLRVAGAPERRREEVTVDEIVALADAATRAGTLLAEEQKLVTRVFELDERTVRTAMVPRDEIVYLLVGRPRRASARNCATIRTASFPCATARSTGPWATSIRVISFSPSSTARKSRSLPRWWYGICWSSPIRSRCSKRCSASAARGRISRSSSMSTPSSSVCSPCAT